MRRSTRQEICFDNIYIPLYVLLFIYVTMTKRRRWTIYNMLTCVRSKMNAVQAGVHARVESEYLITQNE